MDEEERAQILRRLARQFDGVFASVESGHFAACPVCGQFFDLRDFTEVYYHDDDPHLPMKTDA